MRSIARHHAEDISFNLNGKIVSGKAEPRVLLSDYIRQNLGATGTHVGCEHGVCGCCTVMIDGVAQRSCLTLAVQADGRRVTTVEGLADSDGVLNNLQEAFRRHHALQCGFCTAGILMSFTDYLSRNSSPTREQVKKVLGGHICRCTGYEGIISAVLDAAEKIRET